VNVSTFVKVDDLLEEALGLWLWPWGLWTRRSVLQRSIVVGVGDDEGVETSITEKAMLAARRSYELVDLWFAALDRLGAVRGAISQAHYAAWLRDRVLTTDLQPHCGVWLR